jgi:hypothetical protein
MASRTNFTNQKQTFAHFVKKFVPVYGIRTFVTLCPQLVPILSQINLFQTLAIYLIKIHFNIIVPPTIIQVSSRVSVRISCHPSCALVLSPVPLLS